ncbi:molybdenum cofactor guanylyltransferase [Clostridium folliculivorans]|uniref:Probable molybdenum cofactor guanylyltransferase n=1 Tax=Clostridium folliculivorans TaxID=2886038 RepID=A0A9W5Y1E8_9CLOT|nr:molybdenum cofactor guanylyltransferase [Clostridium folliculivorans]GKU24850.1 molybdenum cofactor guanylyltransferase [Clostridium folliculivorans]GKU30948.1 molybdenum cofactor guanylyltransferase [Clostridium folliculivorans]
MFYNKSEKLNIFKTAVILAGGKSSRMGFDKQFLEFEDKQIIDVIAEKLYTCFEEIIVISNKPEFYRDSPYKIISDEIADIGPISGIYEGLKTAKGEYVYFIACDMPIVNIRFIEFMKDRLIEEPKQCCIAERESYIEPFNAFYSKSLLSKVEQMIKADKRALKQLIKASDTLFIEEEKVKSFDCSFEMFMNLNTKEDLDRYIKTYKEI